MSIHVPSIKYERYTVESVETALKQITVELKNAKSADEIIKLRKEAEEILINFSTASTIAYVRFTQNTRDEFYLNEKNYYDEVAPILSGYVITMIKEIMSSPFADEVFSKLPKPLKSMYECKIKSFDEKIIEDMQLEATIVTEYSKLMSEMSFDFNGEKMPLAMLKKYMQDKDRSVREKAYNVLGETLQANSKALDELFDKLVKIRTKMARKLGYENYIELGYNIMERICYNQKDVEKMRANILKDIVPIITKLRVSRAKQMGIDEMKIYDYESEFANGDPTPVLNDEDMFEAGKQMYHEMNPNTADFIDEMLANEAFDYKCRDGKWGGGYMTEFQRYKQQFILANFNGTSADVDVLTHEVGHAFAGFMLNKNDVDYEINMGGMETAETHSMSMEFFCWKWMDKFFGERANDYRYKHLLECFSFLTYGIIVDYFQHVVYANPDMTPAERNAAWAEMEKQFRPYMNANGITYLENGTRWQYQAHIYERPFYYIDYVIAQTTALQFLIESQKDYDNAFKRYYELLEQGGAKFYTTLLKEANLKSPFEEGALRDVAIEIEQLVEKLGK
ncbi:MAG: M3 family oligoendopeptidase [Clostridia bacterium]